MVLDFLQVFVLASIKYLLTLPYALVIGMDYEAAVVAILSGGIVGFFFFYYLRKPASWVLRAVRAATCRIVPDSIRGKASGWCNNMINPAKKALFTRRNRRIVQIKKTYGFWGLIIATPVFLSIPVGAFLASHFYAGNRKIVVYMVLSIITWGGVFSGILRLFPGIMQ